MSQPIIPQQSFTILVVPEMEGSSSTWHFSSKFLKNVVIAGILLGIIFLFVLLHYGYLLWTLDSRNMLERHNRQLVQSLQAIQTQLNPIAKEMRQIKKLSQKLHLLTTTPNIETNENAALPESDLRDRPLSLSALREIEAQHIESQVLLQSTTTLAEEIRKQTISLSQLVDHFQDQGELRLFLPSIHPVKGWFSSPFGMRLDPYTGEQTLHTGIDIAAQEGTIVVAPAAGRVTFFNNDGLLGNLLIIDHGVGYQTQFGHLKEALVKVGTIVERGQPIAQVGNTGKSTGPHLHYEIRKFGIPVNPVDYMID